MPQVEVFVGLPLSLPLQAPSNHDDDLVQSLLCLRAEIRTATSSMTSVPKPLKFLRDKFELLKEAFGKMVSGSKRVKLVSSGM